MEFLGLSIITPSGGSYRATIPVTVVRDIWNGHGKHLPVCFFREDNHVILIPFDEVITGSFPVEVKKRVLEEWGKKVLGQNFYSKLKGVIERLARGEIDSKIFWDQLEREYEKIKERVEPHLRKIKGSLTFTDELESLILLATLAEDEFREQRFREIIEIISEIAAERDHLAQLLDMLRSRSDLEDDLREFVESRIVFELKRVHEELEKIRSVICKP